MRFTSYAIIVVTLYAWLEWRGIDLWPTTKRTTIPLSVRNSPGGYRSYQAYHGYHGGK
jgi:hypothetical protein